MFHRSNCSKQLKFVRYITSVFGNFVENIQNCSIDTQLIFHQFDFLHDLQNLSQTIHLAQFHMNTCTHVLLGN